MSLNSFSAKAGILLVLLLSNPLAVYAGDFVCSIKNVAQLSDNGFFVTHGWSANYLNREFTVERETGKVLRTTALKQRLSNFDRENMPVLLSNGEAGDAFKAVTVFEKNGQYALLEIRNAAGSNPRPFFYHTGIGMILSGTCEEAG
jgi:hypothetical protein